MVAGVGTAAAATLTVNATADVVADDGQCSLREAIEAADTDTASGAAAGECSAGNGADAITFGASGTFVLGAGGALVIDSNLTIDATTRRVR